MKHAFLLFCLTLTSADAGETRSVFVEDIEGARIKVAELSLETDGIYQVIMAEEPFADHFLSMRPFKCLEGPVKQWCHVPYPYEIKRDVSSDLTDLEYDFLFVWKNATEYGINMWNGVYYKLSEENGQWTGVLHEMDMDALSAPPPAGELRPLSEKDLHPSDPESHWLPRLVIE
ncbi:MULTISPECIES: hypothetical protein [Rhodobacterales]|uniref:hypothetical protein n=1 Tax=Rhodobacterales TaxID=204455 RepID=UPI0032986911